MPKQTEVQRVVNYKCDGCTKIESIPVGKKSTWWVAITTVENNGLRLFEGTKDKNRYESFHIPNKREKVYCSRECAIKCLYKSMDLFLSEISETTHRGLKRKQLEVAKG